MQAAQEDWRDLSAEERDLVGILLAKDFPGRDALLEQIKHAKVRRLEAPVLQFRVEAREKARVLHRVPAEAACKDRDGITIHALLFVADGVVQEIEFYKDDGSAFKIPKARDFREVFFQTESGVQSAII